MSFVLGGLQTDVEAREESDSVLVRWMWSHLRGHRWRLAAVVLALVVNSLSVILVPFVLGSAIDALNADSIKLWLIVLALNGFALLTWLTQYVHQQFTTNAVADLTLRAQREALRAALRLDHAFYDVTPSGGVVSRITTDTSTLSSTVQLSLDTLNQLILVVGLSVVLVVLSPMLALALSAIVPVAMLVALVFRRLARQAARQAQASVGHLNANLAETMRGIAVAKSYRQEALLLKQFQQHNQRVYAVSLANNRVFGAIFPILDIITALGTVLVLYVGSRMLLNGTLTPGTWYVGIQAASLLLFPLTGIASFWSQFQQGLSATERVIGLTNAPRNLHHGGVNVPDVPGGRVEISHITLRYGNSPPVFSDLSLAVPSGQSLALVGRTGSGKTSLLRVLMRFYEYQEGTVTVGGYDLRALDPGTRAGLIGVVTQTPMLFDATIAENIRFARPSATDAEVLAAAQGIGADWLREIPEGVQTQVGERGARLSQGQRQLVSLARVMLHNPRILLLDEATASIDAFSELQVQRGLNALMQGRTTITVAHRLSTVSHTDRVVVLEQGRIIADGPHHVLLETNPTYAAMQASYFTAPRDEVKA